MSDWTGKWIAEKMQSHTEVTAAVLLSPQHVQLSRKSYSETIIGTTAVKRLDAAALAPILENDLAVSFVVNVPKESYITGSALRLGAAHGIGLGSVGDLMRAVSWSDVSQYINSEIGFIERGLAQHTVVEKYDRLDDRHYLIHRFGMLAVHVVFLNEYDLTADHVRTARSQYGTFSMLVMTHPAGGRTTSAVQAASAIGCEVYKWGEFLGACPSIKTLSVKRLAQLLLGMNRRKSNAESLRARS